MKNLLLVITLALYCALPSIAATINVPTQYSTIQSGIDAAVNGDTVLVADGVYSGTRNIDLDFSGRTITLISTGGPANCIIDCESSGRGFNFHSGENRTSVVEGFTVINGYISDNGGGISVVNSSPSLKNCIIADNQSNNHDGGGVYVNNGAPIFLNCTFYRNTARYGDGGGIYSVNSSMIVNSSIFYNNRATSS